MLGRRLRRRLRLAVGTLLRLRLSLLRTRGGTNAGPRTGQARLGRLDCCNVIGWALASQEDVTVAETSLRRACGSGISG